MAILGPCGIVAWPFFHQGRGPGVAEVELSWGLDLGLCHGAQHIPRILFLDLESTGICFVCSLLTQSLLTLGSADWVGSTSLSLLSCTTSLGRLAVVAIGL